MSSEKFVIITTQRSGSSWLVSLLNIDPKLIEHPLRFQYKNHSIKDFQSILNTPVTIILKNRKIRLG